MSPPPTPKALPTPSPSTTPIPPTTAHNFPPVQSGGSLLVAYQVRSKPVLVIGGGAVAAGRILSLLNADAHVHLVCPLSGCNAEVLHRIRTCPSSSLTHHDSEYAPSFIHSLSPTLVLTAIDDPRVSSEIYTLCHSLRIPVNVADVPPECDFYFGSVHRDGPLQVMVSTNGNGPKLANIVRRQIAKELPDNLGEAITRVGVLRKRLRKIATSQEEGPKRMEWMSRVCEEWSLADLCQMAEPEMEALLDGFREGRVPTLREIRGTPEEEEEEEEEEEAFDGSFGWF
ncbi:hypothetical protein BZA05DRAFT_427440 [Tricharina praecox]|uniref:uncharacterized protein n=1 Tax=Tricharina praecox TaxID=43433 RepID=UPI00221F619C|nr:uncharacterized protein BZA05DRAFT_427440 [Tricharina praecox]KAI5843272.1 hypothetical protein BZA05DRAFT_427440 [Tricharina praecox]